MESQQLTQKERRAIYMKNYREDHKDDIKDQKALYMMQYNPQYREDHQETYKKQGLYICKRE